MQLNVPHNLNRYLITNLTLLPEHFQLKTESPQFLNRAKNGFLGPGLSILSVSGSPMNIKAQRK